MTILNQDNQVPVDSEFVLSDDRHYLQNPKIGDFEWWYFDFLDKKNEILVKIVLHIGTDALRKKVYPKISISVNTTEISEFFEIPVSMEEIIYSQHPFFVKLNNRFEISGKGSNKLDFKLDVNLDRFQCNLYFEGEINGWKPLSDFLKLEKETKSTRFLWKIAQPKALVNGFFHFKNQEFKIENAIGYHDHNYWNVDPQNPLYIDEIINKWYWMKAYVEEYCIIFMDIFLRKERINMLMITKGDEIILNVDNIDEIYYSGFIKHPQLKVKYATQINIGAQKVNLFFKLNRLVEGKNLLDGVNAKLQWIIKALVSRPVFFSILADFTLNIEGKTMHGLGNYELMEFRNTNLEK